MATAWVLYERSGVMAAALAGVGYTVHSFDASPATYRARGLFVSHHIWDADQGEPSFELHGVPSLVVGFPPCTNLACSGARWFRRKLAADPECQRVAAWRGMRVERLAREAGARWVVENPVGRLSSLWRKPDAWIQPLHYGGYLPAIDAHPTHPRVYPPRDAYKKKTGLWFGGGFVLPPRRTVKDSGAEPTHKRTDGGKLKFARSLTPRGLAIAIALANA